MTDIASLDLSDKRIAFKAQSAINVLASGASAFGVEALDSQGMQDQPGTFESQRLKRNRMKSMSRRGSSRSSFGYETEIIPGALEGLAPAVLGASAWTAQIDLDETDLTSATITGTGTTVTVGGGDLYALGLVAGQFVWFTGLSVTGNNGKWVPVVTVPTATSFTVPSGYLADNTVDTAFTMQIARHILTPTEWVKTYHTIEEYVGAEGDFSYIIPNALFNALSITDGPNAYPRISFGGVGGKMQKLAAGSAPTFTSPDYPTGNSLILIDGGFYINGVKRLDLTGLSLGIQAPVSQTDLIGTTDTTVPKIGTFGFDGSISGVVQDGDDFDDYDTNEAVGTIAHWKDKTTERGIGLGISNMEYASYASPSGKEGDRTQTLKLYAGDDQRGDGYAPTIFLFSDLLATPS